MKLKVRKTFATALTLALLLQVPISASAQLQSVSPNVTESEVETQAIPPIVRSVAVKGLFQLANRVTGRITSKSPQITLGNSRDTASSGTIHFNQGTENAASVRKDVEAVKKGHEIEMWANSGQIGWLGSIAVTLSKPGSSTDAINRTVGHNQYSWFTVEKPGIHVARWTTASKHSWNLWQAYYHWGDLHNYCDSKGNCALPTSQPDVDSESKLFAENQDGKGVVFETVGEFRYLIPPTNIFNSHPARVLNAGKTFLL